MFTPFQSFFLKDLVKPKFWVLFPKVWVLFPNTRLPIQSTNHHDENKYKNNPFWGNPSKACKSGEIENTIIFFGFVFILYFFRFHSWIQTPELNNNCSQSLQDHDTNAMYFRDIQMYFRETQIRVLPNHNNNNNNIRRCAKVIFKKMVLSRFKEEKILLEMHHFVLLLLLATGREFAKGGGSSNRS